MIFETANKRKKLIHYKSMTTLENQFYRSFISKKGFISLFILFPFWVQAQKVYSVKYANQADVKVFVVDYPNQADLKVYKVKYNNQAGKNDGLWFFTQYDNQADKKNILCTISQPSGCENIFCRIS